MTCTNIDNRIKTIVETLKNNPSKRSEFVEFMENIKDPFIVLIACILSLRTNDKTTIGATKCMLKLGKTPNDFAKIDIDTLSHAIYPVGFYRNKANQIINISKELVEKYNSIVPNTIEELVKFKGVGRKTANLTLAKGYNIPAICVDVHVHRISNRLGILKSKTPDETEMILRKILPKKYWLDINTILVTHGQNICKPQKPNCQICPLNHLCSKRIQ